MGAAGMLPNTTAANTMEGVIQGIMGISQPTPKVP